MKYILYFLYVSLVLSFRVNFRKNVFLLKCENNDNNMNNNEVKILNIDFSKMIDEFDNEVLAKIYNNEIPISPQREEDIKEDSFEGYLRSHFKELTENKFIDFERFFEWRKYKIGTVLTKDELENIYYKINGSNECDLMNFILLNKVIDENDGADF